MRDNTGSPISPTNTREELTDQFVGLVNGVSLQVRPTLLDSWSEIELTMHQFRAITMLTKGPLRVTDIAALLGVRLSSATNLADRLEGKRLLERVHDPEDRRVVWCRLTRLGRKEAENLWNIKRQWLENVTNLLTDQELESVVSAFKVLSSALDRHAGESQGSAQAPQG